jgi:hypothetical protein
LVAMLSACEDRCSTIVAAPCTAVVFNAVVEVSAKAEVARRADPAATCPDGTCLPAIASCELPELAPGRYDVRYGLRTETIELPLRGPRKLLFGDPPSYECEE